MSQAEPTGPLYAATLSDSRLGATTVKGHGRLLPAVSATTARSRMGARVLASGMPVGIRLCGVRRRHLFGCQGAVSVCWGPDARGCVTISAASIRRASSAGVSIRDLVPAGTASLSLRQADYLSRDRAEARARVECSTCVRGCVKCMNCDSCDGCDWDDDPRRARRGAKRVGRANRL